MKKRLSTEDEFYVGYMPAAPQHIGSAMRRLIYLLGFVMACTAAIAAWHQKQFSSSNFEFGIYTTAEGFLFAEPFPHLLVTLGKDQDDNDLLRNWVAACRAGYARLCDLPAEWSRQCRRSDLSRFLEDLSEKRN